MGGQNHYCGSNPVDMFLKLIKTLKVLLDGQKERTTDKLDALTLGGSMPTMKTQFKVCKNRFISITWRQTVESITDYAPPPRDSPNTH